MQKNLRELLQITMSVFTTLTYYYARAIGYKNSKRVI